MSHQKLEVFKDMGEEWSKGSNEKQGRPRKTQTSGSAVRWW